MNAYLAEIIAADRMAEFLRDAESGRLIRDVTARRRRGDRSPFVRSSAILVVAAFIVTLWLGLAA